jgi:iron-sulfur cluster repair protein YtfE (RIC family)
MITRSTTIEDLVAVPGAVRYLRQHGIRCLACGEPVWGTLEEAAKEKGMGEDDIDRFVADLNDMARDAPGHSAPSHSG